MNFAAELPQGVAHGTIIIVENTTLPMLRCNSGNAKVSASLERDHDPDRHWA
jgi:hypothetical protein